MRASLFVGLVVLIFASPAAARSPTEATPGATEAAMRRGVAYLLADQNEDGSWGSPAPTLHVDIYAPNKGAFDGYQVASSALALSALIEVGGDASRVQAAIRKGTAWLLEHHQAKRATADVIYNVWAHAYALETFARLLDRETDAGQRAALLQAAQEAVKLLERYEYVDGGWGYYDFSIGTQHPSHGHANSFTTATALVGLTMVEAHGVEVPQRLLRRARRLINASRLPDGAYSYSFNFHFRAPWGVNKKKGSLARTPACLAALTRAGDAVPTRRIVAALDDLERFGHYLRIARKYPRPHETWFQNSGYFCFYGYYYASDLFDDVPAAKAREHAQNIASHLVPLQEKDGSWWDYQLYTYHKPYGTGYVLLTLARCLDVLERDATRDSAASARGDTGPDTPADGPMSERRSAPGGA